MYFRSSAVRIIMSKSRIGAGIPVIKFITDLISGVFEGVLDRVLDILWYVATKANSLQTNNEAFLNSDP